MSAQQDCTHVTIHKRVKIPTVDIDVSARMASGLVVQDNRVVVRTNTGAEQDHPSMHHLIVLTANTQTSVVIGRVHSILTGCRGSGIINV